MRKAVVLFILILSVMLMIVPASAASQVTAAASNANPYRGNEITVTVKVTGTDQHKVGGITVNFDTNVFDLVGGKWLISGLDISYFDNTTKDGGFGYLDAKTISGDVFALTLRVKSGAAFSESTVTTTLTLSGTSYNVSTKVKVTCNHTYSKWAVDGGKHSHTCSICGNKETKDHTWSNDCDISCNDCGTTRTITHKYSTTYTTTAESHYFACTVCGDKTGLEIHTPGEPATEEHAQNCTVCGYEIAPKLDHVHVIVGEQLKDETGHWFDCGTCEEKAEYAEHSYEFECSTSCTVCGYIRETEHTLAEGEDLRWESDENGHWHSCTICGEAVDAEEHTSDKDPVKPACSVCGEELTHVHAFSDKWTCDGEYHWHECACGEMTDITEHTLGEGVLTVEPQKDAHGEMVFTCTICGGEKKALVIGSEADVLPWIIVCCVLGVLLIGALVLIIVVIVKINKKPAGRFASK